MSSRVWKLTGMLCLAGLLANGQSALTPESNGEIVKVAAVTDARSEMGEYANKILALAKTYPVLKCSSDKVEMCLNGIYQSGGYFFYHFSLNNNSSTRFSPGAIMLTVNNAQLNEHIPGPLQEFETKLAYRKSGILEPGVKADIIYAIKDIQVDGRQQLEVFMMDASGSRNLKLVVTHALVASSLKNTKIL